MTKPGRDRTEKRFKCATYSLRVLAFCFLATLLLGCARTQTHALPAAPQVQVWGERGAAVGEFTEPRAVAVSREGFAYIVDSSGRIQKWTTDGKPIKQWMAPNIKRGRPEGIAITKDGEIAVTNTHDSRILFFSPEGKLLRQFGKYGTQRGGFLLVTGICVDKAGNIYASDYGGENDRVSKWSDTGKLLASWPGHGEGKRQFRRPCGLAIAKSGELLVADINNHRIQRLNPNSGKYLGQFGTRGHNLGQLNYPYGVAVDKDGFVYTVEYGNHRVQKWSSDFKPLAQWGGPGRAIGKLANPWGLGVDENGNVYVADTQNHRVQKFHF
jgi:DNA-binding beta-propeller fold protein YncE